MQTDITIVHGAEDINMKTTPYNDSEAYVFHSAKRCGEKTRTGKSCRAPAVKDKPRCRFHGCGRGSGAPRGNTYAVTHGETTAEVKAFRREVCQMLKKSRELKKQIG